MYAIQTWTASYYNISSTGGQEHSGVFSGDLPLANQIVESFHGAFTTVTYLSTSFTHVQALVQRMSYAAKLLAIQFIPAPTIVMSFQPAVGARFIHREAIRTTFQTLLTRIRTLNTQILHPI